MKKKASRKTPEPGCSALKRAERKPRNSASGTEVPAIVGETALLADLREPIRSARQGIVSTLSTQLSWSHFIESLPIKDALAREFYAEMWRIERWVVRGTKELP